MEEPMGPRPYWATRIFFFTLEFLSDLRSQYVKGLADGLQPNLRALLARGGKGGTSVATAARIRCGLCRG